MKRKIILLSILITSLLGCNMNNTTSSIIDNSSNTENTTSSSSSTAKDLNLAINYDFGDPSTWKGEDIKVKDLGDLLLDAYPYDEMYDWGQSIMYDSTDNLYKMW